MSQAAAEAEQPERLNDTRAGASAKSESGRVINVCFTVWIKRRTKDDEGQYNGSEEVPFDVPAFMTRVKEYCGYMIMQQEHGEFLEGESREEMGHCPIHWQGYMELKRRMYLPRQIKKLLFDDEKHPVHLEKRKGSPREASDYCRKTDSQMFPFASHGIEYGKMSLYAVAQDAKYTEMAHDMREAMLVGRDPFYSIFETENGPEAVRAPNGIRELARSVVLEHKRNRSERRVNVDCVALVGEAGSGKSRTSELLRAALQERHIGILEIQPGDIRQGGQGFWAPACIRSHHIQAVFINECIEGVGLGQFLSLCDPTRACKVQIKGDPYPIEIAPLIVVITYNKPADQWWGVTPTATERHGIMRRITQYHYFQDVTDSLSFCWQFSHCFYEFLVSHQVNLQRFRFEIDNPFSGGKLEDESQFVPPEALNDMNGRNLDDSLLEVPGEEEVQMTSSQQHFARALARFRDREDDEVDWL